MGKHLAQLNIARWQYRADDPRAADFINNVERINGLAERSDGFVWRLSDESEFGSVPLLADPALIATMSVWESPEMLEKFVWQTVHKKFYNRKGEWFAPMGEAHFVMWWVDQGHHPTAQEAADRLQYLREHGPSDHAFGWESLPQVQLWKK
ncbi:MAG: DUF3291 domain-containing protein, partial [Alphaproteobacteria bacterium]